MRRAPLWMRLAAALYCSVLLHVWLFGILRLPQPVPKASRYSLTVSLLSRESPGAQAEPMPSLPPATLPKQKTREPSKPREPAPAGSGAAPARRAGETQQTFTPPRTTIRPGQPSVSAGPISAPRVPPASALGNAAGYLGEAHLSAPPRIAGEFVAAYPPEAAERRRSGTVIVQLMIDTDGRVAEALALPGAPADLAEAALEALRRTRFTPAQANKTPARARVYFAVSFVIE